MYDVMLTDECFSVTVNVSLSFKDAYFDVPITVFHYLCIRPQELSNELKYYVFGDVWCFILSSSCYDVSTLP